MKSECDVAMMMPPNRSFVATKHFLPALFLAVLVMGNAVAQEQQSATPYQAGQAAMKNHDYDGAIAQLTEAIQANPQFAMGYFTRALAYMQEGKDDLAIADLDRAIQIDPHFAKAYFRRAFFSMADKKYDNALTDLSQAIQVDPKFWQAYFRRAFVYMIKGNYDQAVTDLDQVVALNPTFPKAYLRRAYANTMKGNFAQSFVNLNEVIQLNPQDPEPYNRMAWIMAVCPQATFRNGPKAVENATKACDLTQWKSAPYIDTLAAAYAESGDFANAVKYETDFLSMIGADPDRTSAAQSRLALYQSKQPYHVDKFVPELVVVF